MLFKTAIYRRILSAITLILAIQITASFAQQTIRGRQILKGNWRNQQTEYVDGQIFIKIRDGSNLPSGVYFYRLQAQPINGWQAGRYSDVKKMLLCK